MNAQVEMFMYANELAAQRRDEPRDDIITALLDAEVDGDRLTEMDFNLFFLLIAVAGNETTRNSISHGIKAFCDFPDQYQLLVEDPSRRAVGDRGDRALGVAGHVLPPQRHARHRAARPAAQGRRQGQHLVHLGEPRRRRVRPAVRVRHPALRRTSTSASAAAARTTASARTSRAWRSTCCSRRWPSACPTIERTGDAQPLRSNFIAGIKHMPVKYPAGRARLPGAALSATRRFRFGVELHGPFDGQHVDRHRPRGRSARVLDAVRARPLRRRARADRGDGERGRGHDDAEGRLARVRLRLPPSRGARARAGDDRPASPRAGSRSASARAGSSSTTTVPGIPMDAPKVRVDRMIEHTKILKALFADEPVTFNGEHYRITDLPGHAASAHAGRSADPHRRRRSGACCGSRARSPTSSA